MKKFEARKNHLRRFYNILGELEQRLGGARKLSTCDGRMEWPTQGCYFFFEPSELRSDSDEGLRVTRVGTHAVSFNSKTTLWNRLSQHRGNGSGTGGNHRGSIFRKIVGESYLAKRRQRHPSWGNGSSAPKEVREKETPLEVAVGEYIGAMPFLWLSVPGVSRSNNLRAVIEQNSIAILSNFPSIPENALDGPSETWLGRHCPAEKVRFSGLWNSNHVEQEYDPRFLEHLQALVQRI